MKSSKKSYILEKWVLNSSPIIALSRVHQLELLIRLPEQIVLPQAVADELLCGPNNDPARKAVENGLFKIVKTPTPPSEILSWDLGKGETSVLAHAFAHHGWISVIDDSAARRCARSFSIPVKGTLAIIILAKQHGLIESAASVLHNLKEHEFRLDDALIHNVLARTTGESWPV